jgi:hypothetical protein
VQRCAVLWTRFFALPLSSTLHRTCLSKSVILNLFHQTQLFFHFFSIPFQSLQAIIARHPFFQLGRGVLSRC